MKLKRPLFPPDEVPTPMHGRDVLAIKRALGKVETDFFPKPPGGYDDVYNRKTADAVQVFQRIHRLPATGRFGQGTLDALEPYFDAYGKYMYTTYRVPPILTPQDIAFEKLLAAMKVLDAATPGYQLGGGHGMPLETVSPYQKLDCSSSTSKALYEAGLWPKDERYAWVSGRFATSYGIPGPGLYFTIYAHQGHVFTRLHRSRYWRFDTSPQGDGGRGPKLRYLPRFTSGFVARHWPGM